MITSLRWIGCLAALTAVASAEDTPSWEAAFSKGVVKQETSNEGKRSTPLPPPSQPVRPPAASPPLPVASTGEQAITDAESLVATFNAAVDAGANAFSTMRSTQEVVAALAVGVRGAGRFGDTSFRVPGLDDARQRAALQRLRIERGRIVVAPLSPLAGGRAGATHADPYTHFAGGSLKLILPDGFVGEETADGDLLMRTEGASITAHLEASAPGLKAWDQVRAASDRHGKTVSVAGKKIYIIEPDRRTPRKVTVGFGQTLVSLKVEDGTTAEGNTRLRFALAGIVKSLTAVR